MIYQPFLIAIKTAQRDWINESLAYNKITTILCKDKKRFNASHKNAAENTKCIACSLTSSDNRETKGNLPNECIYKKGYYDDGTNMKCK